MVINEQVVSSGRIPSAAEVHDWLEKAIAKK
jgi:disulfide oxidoreductase YuzD